MEGELISVERPIDGSRRRAIWKRTYCTMLGAQTLPELGDNIVSRVTNKLREKASPIPPVRISRVAADFLVKPEPEFEPNLPAARGKLVFENDSGWFKVVMRPEKSLYRVLPRNYLDGETSFEDCLTWQGRFTYAHEFVHRFFFVPIQGARGWQRAIDAVIGMVDLEVAVATRRYLQDREESLCNNIARRILLPQKELAEFVQRRFQQEGESLLPQMGKIIQTVSRCFLVPTESALLALGDALHEGYLKGPPELFAICIDAQVSRPGSVRSGIRNLRIKSAIIGRVPISKSSEKPFFRLSDPQVLGPALREHCVELLSSRQLSPEKTVEIPLVFPFKSGSDVVCLKGWSQSLVSPNAHSEFRRGLIWGQLF